MARRPCFTLQSRDTFNLWTDEPEIARGQTPMFHAAQNGHLDVVRFLVEAGAAKDQADNSGATPLFTAVQNGHLDIVRFLVQVGAAKDQADNAGAKPLFTAAQNGHLSLQIESFRMKDDPKSTNFNNITYTISFPNSRSGLVFTCTV